MDKQVKFQVKLTEDEASQLMLLLTTMGISDYRELAGSDNATCLMQSAGEKLRRKLVEQGFKHQQYIEQMQGNNEFFRRLMHQSPISMQIYTPDAILREANQAFDELFHVSSDLLVGKYNVLEDPEVARIGAIPFLERVLAGGTVASHEFLYDAAKGMSDTGRKRWLRTRIYPIKDTHDKVINFVIAHEDITELKQYQENLQGLVEQRTKELSVAVEKLEVLSRTDGLTGLGNRWHLDQVLDEELRRAKRQKQSVVVILIDVDHFKKFNDHYGHQAGDDCLRSIAAVLAAHSKRAGDLAARYGGEEFVLVLPSADQAWGMTLAEAVRNPAVAAHRCRSSQAAPISPSWARCVFHPPNSHSIFTCASSVWWALVASRACRISPTPASSKPMSATAPKSAYGSRAQAIAGDCAAWTSGWVEGALQTGLNAAAGVIKSLQGTLNGDANGRSPLDIKADRFNYSGA